MWLPRLRDLREDHDLKQKDLAKYLNVTQKTYSRYERGEHDVPIEVVLALAAYYHVSTDYLLGATDTKRRYPKSKTLYPHIAHPHLNVAEDGEQRPRKK